jgi:hypothetical protein
LIGARGWRENVRRNDCSVVTGFLLGWWVLYTKGSADGCTALNALPSAEPPPALKPSAYCKWRTSPHGT